MFEPVDVSNWNKKPWFNTGGTRDKVFLESPRGWAYYFKRSLYKPATQTNPERSYEYEFWNEIIVYHYGKSLGFNVLKYEVGVMNDQLGCLCENMISDVEELVEGIKYINRYDPSFRGLL